MIDALPGQGNPMWIETATKLHMAWSASHTEQGPNGRVACTEAKLHQSPRNWVAPGAARIGSWKL